MKTIRDLENYLKETALKHSYDERKQYLATEYDELRVLVRHFKQDYDMDIKEFLILALRLKNELFEIAVKGAYYYHKQRLEVVRPLREMHQKLGHLEAIIKEEVTTQEEQS